MDLDSEIGPRQKLTMEETRDSTGNSAVNDSIIQAHKEFVLVKVGGNARREGRVKSIQLRQLTN